MHQVFIEGGLIRKVWPVEAAAYRDHLLRLDVESRRNRFCAAIADDAIRGYAATARGGDVILHGFFVDGVLRGVADLRILGREAEAAFSIEKLARKFEAELSFDSDAVIGTMESPHPTPLSLMREWVADGHSFAAACVDFQSRMWMPIGHVGARPPYQIGLPVR